MLKFKFSDTDWTDIDGHVLKMSLGSEFFANSRLTANYLAPVVTMDSWNGRSFPVQKNIWESYIVEFKMSEMGIHLLSKLQSCDNIELTDTELGETITIDTHVDGGITIEPGNRYMSTGQVFSMICRTRKISTYPGISKNHTYNATIISSLTTYLFYTDFAPIPFISDSEKKQFDREDGIVRTAKTSSSEGFKMLFYLMQNDAIALKKRSENLGYSAFTIFDGINNINVIEVAKCKLDQLPEGLMKCELEVVTNPVVNYA